MPDAIESPWPDKADRCGDALTIDGVSLDDLANEHGTPLYVVDVATVRNRVTAWQVALRKHYGGPTRLNYAAKAFLCTALVPVLTESGCGFDLSSFGEAAVVLAGGGSLGSSHLHGNAKPDEELRRSLDAGIGWIVIDNLSEVDRVTSVAARLGRVASVLVRVSPGAEVKTHPHVMTGHRDAKFGVPLEQLDVVASAIVGHPELHFDGLHFHLGSQLLSPSAQRGSIDVVVAAARALRRSHGLETRVLSPGGGLGIAYTGAEKVPTIDSYAGVIATTLEQSVARHGLPLPTLVVEPGRSIIGPAVVAIYRVLGSKPLSTGRRLVHVDGGMADDIRPALYSAELSATLVSQTPGRDTEIVDITGRYCESSDILCRDVRLPAPAIGDLVAVPAVGAYTLSMASNYNGTLRPAVVAIDAGQASVWQRRETYDDLLARDLIPG